MAENADSRWVKVCSMDSFDKKSQTNWHVYEDADSVAMEAAQRILRYCAEAISDKGVFRLVLSGGHTPEACYRLLTQADTDWSRWEIYFGDERCLPVDHPGRNSVMAHETFLDAVPIPSANIYPIPGEKGAEAAAAEYEAIVNAAMPFDVVLLGIGEDGHTASIFPGQPHPSNRSVFPVHDAPKPPPDRVSLSIPALSNAMHILVLATGAGKKAAIRAWKEGTPLPVAEIGGNSPVDVLMDRAAQP